MAEPHYSSLPVRRQELESARRPLNLNSQMPTNKPTILKEGDPAPDVRLETDSGEILHLAGLKGKHVVLFFYPKADTPGCTVEACEFRDTSVKFTAIDAVILGVSPDGVAAQGRFKDKYGLPFTLLADIEHTAAEAFGVWKEKTLYGRKHMGIERTTFLIGKDGRIAHIFAKVKPAGHAAEVLEALAALR
jgi:peroxiredoxin Q/BCP